MAETNANNNYLTTEAFTPKTGILTTNLPEKSVQFKSTQSIIPTSAAVTNNLNTSQLPLMAETNANNSYLTTEAFTPKTGILTTNLPEKSMQFKSTQSIIPTSAAVTKNLNTSQLPLMAETNANNNYLTTEAFTPKTGILTTNLPEKSMQFKSTQSIIPTSAAVTKNLTSSQLPLMAETNANNKYLTTDTLSSTTSSILQTTTSMGTIVKVTTDRIDLCPMSIQLEANGKSGTTLAQYGHKCYEIVQNKVSWSHAERICQTNKGHLVDIGSQQEQDFLNGFLVNMKSHTVWLGLNDRNTEEKFVWTSGSPVTYTNWKAGRKDLYHRDYDCVYMTANGTWDDIKCGSDDPSTEQQHSFLLHSYVCQYGRTDLCPMSIQLEAKGNSDTTLTQYGNKCYEIVQNKVSWSHAERICQTNKGHLVDIGSQQEQDFLNGFLANMKSHTVWLGLNDRNTEEKFVWTSGRPVTYTNWKAGRKDLYHRDYDCVYMTANGTWDDIKCGSDDPSTEQQQGFLLHSYVCQFVSETPGGAPIIG